MHKNSWRGRNLYTIKCPHCKCTDWGCLPPFHSAPPEGLLVPSAVGPQSQTGRRSLGCLLPSMWICPSESSGRWNPSCVLPGVWLPTQSTWRVIVCYACPQFFYFYVEWFLFGCTLFIHLPAEGIWHVSSFWLLWIKLLFEHSCSSLCVNIHVDVLFFWVNVRSGIAELCGRCKFGLIRNCQAVFLSDWANWASSAGPMLLPCYPVGAWCGQASLFRPFWWACSGSTCYFLHLCWWRHSWHIAECTFLSVQVCEF